MTEPASTMAPAADQTARPDLGQVVRPKSLTDVVLKRLRAAIVDGRIAMGEQLSEVTIAVRLNVSRTPVREAFLALKAQGLVEIRPQRGTFVFRPTPTEVLAISDLRAVLEVGATRLAAERDLAGLVDALTGNLERMDALPVDRLAEGIDLDTSFHAILVDRSQQPLSGRGL